MKIIVNNLATEYQDKGTGETMLLFHGWKDDLHTFDPLAEFLSATHRIIRIDLPGFGSTETPRGAWTVDDYVQFVSDFVQKLGIRVDTLVGHSFGGRIAMKGLAADKLHARKLILFGSAGIAKKQPFRKCIIRVFAKIGGALMSVPPLAFWRDAMRKKIYRIIGSDYPDSGMLRETFLNIVSEDLSEHARKITIPTLLVWGADDTETPLSDGERLSQLIQGSQLKVLEGVGHFVHKEKPREVAKYMQEFL